MSDRFHFERECIAKGHSVIAGIDESGRGPLAGPLFVAALIFPIEWIEKGLPKALKGLNDSKSISANRRQSYFDFLCSEPEIDYAIVSIEPSEIDEINILQATHQGMLRAIEKLSKLDCVLIDGLPIKVIKKPQTALIKGDTRSYSIAAASVLAKVSRDREMIKHDARFPLYGFARHKGYATRAHLDALKRLGPCPIHRQSFAPVQQRQRDLW